MWQQKGGVEERLDGSVSRARSRPAGAVAAARVQQLRADAPSNRDDLGSAQMNVRRKGIVGAMPRRHGMLTIMWRKTGWRSEGGGERVQPRRETGLSPG